MKSNLGGPGERRQRVLAAGHQNAVSGVSQPLATQSVSCEPAGVCLVASVVSDSVQPYGL